MENKKNIILRITEFLKPYKWLLAKTIILNAIFSFLATISVALIKPVLEVIFKSDAVQKAQDTSDYNILKEWLNGFFNWIYSVIDTSSSTQTQLIRFSLLIIGVFFLKNIFKYWSSIASTRLEEGIVKSVRDRLFEKISNLSLDFFSRNKQGNLISVIANDVNTLNGSTTNAFITILREVVQAVGFLLVLFAVSPLLCLISFSASLLSLIVIKLAIKYLRRYATRMQNAMADYTTSMQETISGIRVVKAYNAEEDAAKRFKKDTDSYVRSSIKHKKIITLIPSINEVFAIFALCVVLFVGGMQVINGQLEPEQLFLFLFALFSIMSPVSAIMNSVSGFQRGVVAAEKIYDILDTESKVVSGTRKLEGFNAIQVENVSFAYKDENVVKNATFTLPKGKKIAFVGPSGSGKSTMLDLIIRFYDVNEGSIKLDGIDIKEFETKSFRSLFGLVSQETMLFNDTIANNIRYGKKEATYEEIKEAARIAHALDFIEKLPNGFETYTGDRGISLSGGERQRIAIARALLNNPEALLFDEATSALDAESEKIVQNAINDSLKDKTAIIVAHRLATIIDCDLIYVFERGEIVESGSHSELIAKEGLYKKLYDIQFSQEEIVKAEAEIS